MAQDTAKPARKPSGVKTGYLVLYNLVSAQLWLLVFCLAVARHLVQDPVYLHNATSALLPLVKWTQTLMILDVLHGLFGIVRSSPITAAMQVASRYVAVWGVQVPFPQLTSSPIYSSMLFAWSLTEVVRYFYLAMKLTNKETPTFTWIRYSSYILLYPMGIMSEMGMMWLAITGPAKEQIGTWYQACLAACLFVIWPFGAYTLIGHMNRQRRKVLSNANAKKTQ